MGLIRVRDDDDDESQFLTRWNGTVEVEMTNSGPRVLVSRDAPFEPADVEVTGVDAEHARNGYDTPWWLLVVPTVLTALAVAVGLTGAFDRLPLAYENAATLGVYGLAYLFALAGTIFLYNDAAHLQTANAGWQPNPWHYVAAGAAVLTALFVVLVGVPAGPERAGRVLAGVLLASGAASSAVVGPVYLFLRRRAIGLR